MWPLFPHHILFCVFTAISHLIWKFFCWIAQPRWPETSFSHRIVTTEPKNRRIRSRVGGPISPLEPCKLRRQFQLSTAANFSINQAATHGRNLTSHVAWRLWIQFACRVLRARGVKFNLQFHNCCVCVCVGMHANLCWTETRLSHELNSHGTRLVISLGAEMKDVIVPRAVKRVVWNKSNKCFCKTTAKVWSTSSPTYNNEKSVLNCFTIHNWWGYLLKNR